MENGEEYRIDLTGRKFGRLTVIKSVGKKGKVYYWVCRCICGATTEASTSNLNAGKVTGCGCSHAIPDSLLIKYGRAVATALMKKYREKKHGTKARGLSFNLSPGEFCKLMTGQCFYCGGKPKTPVRVQLKKSIAVYVTGIDRYNNAKGYSLANCISCCKQCNSIKRMQDHREFVEHCIKIAVHQGRMSDENMQHVKIARHHNNTAVLQ